MLKRMLFAAAVTGLLAGAAFGITEYFGFHVFLSLKFQSSKVSCFALICISNIYSHHYCYLIVLSLPFGEG